jgi:hypothetical protein
MPGCKSRRNSSIRCHCRPETIGARSTGRWRGQVPGCLLAAVDHGDAANIADWFGMGHGSGSAAGCSTDSCAAERSACGTSPSESLPGVCPDPQRQGALDAEHVSGPTRPNLCPERPGLAGGRAALATARGRQARPVDLTSYAEPTRKAHRWAEPGTIKLGLWMSVCASAPASRQR